MAFTYTTLKAEIRSYLEITSDDFSADSAVLNDTDIAVIVKQAEDRILQNVTLPEFRKSITDTLSSSSEYLAVPSDYLKVYSFAVDNSGYVFLLRKHVSFIREAYPLSTTEGVPKYYAIFNETNFILAPTPDSNYSVELNYFYRPTSIVDAATSWLGTNAESALFSGCILEAYIFLKGDPDLLAVYEARYKEALESLAHLGEGLSKFDDYRDG